MDNNSGTGTRLPESPRVPMEFLSRSWSASAVEVSKALSPHISMLFKAAAATTTTTTTKTVVVPERISGGESDDHHQHKKNYSGSTAAAVFTNNNNPLFPFAAASSATSQRVLDRILSQSQSSQMMMMMQQQDGVVVSPLTSGRPSLSSEPNYLNNNNNGGGGASTGGGGDSCGSSPPISPSSQDFYDVVKFLRSSNTPQPQFNGGGRSNTTTANGGGKTVGRWLKDRREKKKEETRAHNAQLHAAISVAGVAAAVAAIAAATAASSGPGLGEKKAKTDTAVASAATLVAAQCVEAAEALGAERDHLASVISSAVNVRSCDDIVTLTAGAATALRGAATLKARALKDVWNVAAETPVQKAMGTTNPPSHSFCNSSYSGDLDGYSLEFLARGCELLKRTRKGDLHWKIVSVYLHRSGQVMLKMKSRHVGGTITKKKKNVVQEVYKDMPAWPGRHFLEGREHRYYFGLRTEMRGIVEFECKNQKEHDLWTQGVLNLLAIVAEKKYRRQT